MKSLPVGIAFAWMTRIVADESNLSLRVRGPEVLCNRW